MTTNQTIDEYLNQLGSSEPTPGGGSVTALTGAQAVGLLQMVCSLTQGDKFAAVKENVAQITDELIKSRSRFTTLKEEDEQAFESLMTAYRLPKASENEKSLRDARISESLYLAAKAPLGMLEEAVRLIPTTARLAEIGNRNLITDVGVAVHLLDATIQGARLNILVNLRLVNNPKLDQECKHIITTAEKLMLSMKTQVLNIVNSLLEKNSDVTRH